MSNIPNSVKARTLKFFTREDGTDFYTCNICSENGTKVSLSGKKISNLTSHVKSKHDILHATQIVPEHSHKYALKRLKKIQSFCEIIALDGRPFVSLLGTGFQHSQEDDLNELAAAGYGIQLDKQFTELKAYIKNVSNKIRDSIKIELKDRFVSLMLDIATKNRKSVLGVSVQFLKDDKVAIRTLGHIILTKSHKSKYIVDMLLKCLNEFNVQIDHVVTITTDNAANMLAMTHQFDEYVQIDDDYDDTISVEGNDNQIPAFNHDGPLNDAEMEQILKAAEDREALNSILDEQENFDELFVEIIGELSKNTRFVTTVRCGGHTVQLVTRDGLKKSGFKSILTLCQHVVKKLRLDSFKEKAEEANIKYKHPRLNMATRWDSDLYMLSDIVECESAIAYFQQHSEFKAIHQKMPAIKEAVKILQIPFEVTKVLQKPDCTMSEFYASCITMREKLKIVASKPNKKTDLAGHLLAEFEKRKGQMLKNEAMLSAVHLDRRFAVDLTEREVELAKMSLCNMWDRFRQAKKSVSENQPQQEPDEAECAEDEGDEFNFDLSSYLKSKAGVIDQENEQEQESNGTIDTNAKNNEETVLTCHPNHMVTRHEFLIQLKNFEEKYKLLKHKTNILEFWKNQKGNWPEIYAIASIYNAIPPSQATVERTFSTLTYIFGPLRSNLNTDLLSNIMLIKLNSVFLNEIFSNERLELQNNF